MKLTLSTLISARRRRHFRSKIYVIISLISKSIELLISTLDSKLEACFIQLTKVQWDQYEDFGEESRYIKDAK